ncbi:hypothetical protein MNBD_ALPHA03-557 [hydrothermal vent metagenome]|uniref:Methyltransferase type 11 domain-containing protein n=1 Tax=hydrothermal vent metagenome TaxID=652676 RepID=A0A3B1AQZ7_9ZZZZ
MTGFKDYFSTQSKAYGRFRPQYPEELYEYLSGLCEDHELAWDCATGTGQAAGGLSDYFNNVVATDASATQIENTQGPGNVVFQSGFAEKSGLAAQSVDIITVAQALHWFDLDGFYREARRVLKPNAVLAVWTYNLLEVGEENIDLIIKRFDEEIVGEYWPEERQLVRDNYAAIDFPFNEEGRAASIPEFNMTMRWSLDDLMGYLATWSSVAAYKAAKGCDPLREIYSDLCAVWGAANNKKNIKWPLSFKIGRV